MYVCVKLAEVEILPLREWSKHIEGVSHIPYPDHDKNWKLIFSFVHVSVQEARRQPRRPAAALTVAHGGLFRVRLALCC